MSVTKVIYGEFFVFVNPETYAKWKDGDKSIPVIEVVDAAKIYHTGGQGFQGQPSKQQLEAAFETSNEDDVILFILNEGKAQHSDTSVNRGNLNPSRGSAADKHKGATTGF